MVGPLKGAGQLNADPLRDRAINSWTRAWRDRLKLKSGVTRSDKWLEGIKSRGALLVDTGIY